MNPAYEAIRNISKDVISQYNFPVWGRVVAIIGKHPVLKNCQLVDVEIKDPSDGSKRTLTNVPTLGSGNSKGIAMASLSVGDYVKIVFESGGREQPVIVGMLDPTELKNHSAGFPNMLGGA